MQIEQCFKYKKDDKIYVGGSVPKGAETLETMDILVASEGSTLVKTPENKEVGTSLWLKDGDTKENYIEVKLAN